MKRNLGFALCLLILFSCNKDKDDNSPVAGYSQFRATGASAADLLSAKKFKKIVVQISFMPGYAPDAPVTSRLQNMLESYCNKPGGVTIVQQQINGNGNATLNLDQVANLEKKVRTITTIGDVLSVHVLITDGHYTQDDVLGIAYWNTSLCIFGKTIYDHSGGIGQVGTDKLESTVLHHEFGHLLGLVGLGVPMSVNHKDAPHGNHCDNEDCLMYYGVETSGIAGPLFGKDIPVFDLNCHHDLQAAGGK